MWNELAADATAAVIAVDCRGWSNENPRHEPSGPRGRWRLIEAADPEELTGAVLSARARAGDGGLPGTRRR
ncbi:hypothetical protein GCM10023196_034410 [Actinoallomurus vinaceus]|uniref:Uncharacterized protein n=1 Tax=Actinoallomurus vinaceus TaxID=1080074 RepID=A0ABP8U8I4_9ACTN